MSERLDQLERRLSTVRDLQDIVGAMLSLASIRLQQAQASLPGTRSYAEVVREALHRALSLLPEDHDGGMPFGRTAQSILIVFGAEHGFTGAFNRRLIDSIKMRGHETLLIVGTRGAALCRERGIRFDWATPMATHVEALMGTIRRLVAELHRRIGTGAVGSVEVVYARYIGAGQSEIRREMLFPIADASPRARGTPPLLNLPPERLAERLVEEHLFGALAHAGMESVASESGARLLSMQFARHNIDDKRTELERDERMLRQEEITIEMLDVVTGAASMAGETR